MQSRAEGTTGLARGTGGAGGEEYAQQDRYDWLWEEYLRAFPAIALENIRAGCHPRRMIHKTAERAVVLVHGLSDSPLFMQAIGLYFHEILGYNVYLPLLPCHGLKDPRLMAGVTLAEWKRSVRFAVLAAGAGGTRVSVGGFSLGGILSLYMACTEEAVAGELYLFAAALGLAPGFGPFCGIKEFLLRLPFAERFDSGEPLIGDNPYRYSRVCLNGAVELVRLIGEVDGMLRKSGVILPRRRIFAAWSEYDQVVCLKKLRKLQRLAGDGRYAGFVIPAGSRVDHASLVLAEPIFPENARPGQAPLEPANPFFREMVAAMGRFAAGG